MFDLHCKLSQKHHHNKQTNIIVACLQLMYLITYYKLLCYVLVIYGDSKIFNSITK